MARRSVRDWWWYGLCALVTFTMVAVVVPLLPIMPTDGLDPSWRLGMNQAMAQGLLIGKDIVFTFGPYAAIYTRVYHPATDQLTLVVSLYLALSFSLALLCFTGRTRPVLAVMVTLVLAIGSSYVNDVLFFAYPLLVALYAGNVLPERERVSTPPFSLVFLLYVPLGLLPLIKGSFVGVSCAAAFAAAILWAHRGNWKLALTVACGPVVGLVIFWCVAAQPIGELPTYIGAMLANIAGYTESMATPGLVSEIWIYLGAAALLIGGIVVARGRTLSSKAYVTIFAGFSLFVAFKAGFVRHDGHALIAAFFLLFCAVIVWPFSARKLRIAVILVALVCAIHSANYHVGFQGFSAPRIIYNVYLRAVDGLRMRASGSDVLPSAFTHAMKAIAQQSGVVSLAGSTDIYSYNQSGLLATGNNWDPRPVFQSYAASTPGLLELNRQHLLGAKAPDNVIFKIEPIDGRLPAMEDGASWPVLLQRYRPVNLRDHDLYLQRNQAQFQPAAELASGSYRLGSTATVPESDEPVVAEIHLRRTLWGRIVNALFKPAPLKIQLTLQNGDVRTYKVVSSMVETGVVLSPLVENTADFAMLYAKENYLANKKVSSFKISSSAGWREWGDDYVVQYKKLSVHTVDDVKRLFSFDHEFMPSALPIRATTGCDGSIDMVNSTTPAPASFVAGALLEVNGWFAQSVKDGLLAKQTFVVLTDRSGKRTFFNTHVSPRPDVGKYFKKPQLDAAGYSAMIDTSSLNGTFAMDLGYLGPDGIEVCAQYGISATFRHE